MSEPLKQIAALPIVETRDGPLVLLVTTRGRGRWTIPRGWPKPGTADNEMAAKEAADEAGVDGKIGKWPIGRFTYTKRLHFYSWAKCVVDVYPLYVKTHHLEWRERGARKVRWATPEDAAGLVADAELAELVRSHFHVQAA